MEKITCITICRNNKEGLLKTVESVLAQTVPLYEMVIVDGDSTDGTKQLLPEIESRFEKRENVLFHCVSEPDNGIYDAMNKGIDMAHGDWLIFMNSGDRFAGDTVLEQLAAVTAAADVGVVYGDQILEWPDGKTEKRMTAQENFQQEVEKRMPAGHQAMLFRRELMTAKKYSEEWSFIGDYAWVLEYSQSGGMFQYVPINISLFEIGGVSSQSLYRTFCAFVHVQNMHGVGPGPAETVVKKMIRYIFDFVISHVSWKLRRALSHVRKAIGGQ